MRRSQVTEKTGDAGLRDFALVPQLPLEFPRCPALRGSAASWDLLDWVINRVASGLE